MALIFDLTTFVITVPQADLTPLGGSSYSLDTNLFRISLKDWEDSEEGIAHPKTHTHNTSVNLGGIEYARVIEILSPWTITFEELVVPYRVTLVGSNNNILQVTNLGTVQILSSNSAGLINLPELQQSAFESTVTVDQVNGTIGQLYPIGTLRQPAKQISDAVAIASARNLNTIRIRGVYSSASEASSGLLFEGLVLNDDRLNINLPGSFVGCNYVQMWIKGTGIIAGTFEKCFVEDVPFLLGGAKDTGFLGEFGFYPAPPFAFQMFNCHTSKISNAQVTLNMNSTVTVLMHACTGNWLIKGLTTGVHVFSMSGAKITLDPTCTGGTVVIRGDTICVNNSTGTIIQDERAVGLNDDDRTKLSEIHGIHGLNIGTDLVVAPTYRQAGSISQTIFESGNIVTVTRV